MGLRVSVPACPGGTTAPESPRLDAPPRCASARARAVVAPANSACTCRMHYCAAMALCKVDCDVEAVFRLYSRMQATGVEPDRHNVSCMIATCSESVRKLSDQLAAGSSVGQVGSICEGVRVNRPWDCKSECSGQQHSHKRFKERWSVVLWYTFWSCGA